MAYSKEAERQNKALGDVLAGRTPEKRVMVGYEGKKQESGDQISRLSDIMKEARMPMFCPKCDVIMKKRLDNKFWGMFGHCFDCQVKIENKMRIAGTYDEWEKNRKQFVENHSKNLPYSLKPPLLVKDKKIKPKLKPKPDSIMYNPNTESKKEKTFMEIIKSLFK